MTEVEALRAYRRDVFAALRRGPERARELRKWERAVAGAGTIDEARRASAEVGKLLDAACREVDGA
ncbi:hypothetical protein [Streptomyces sp. RTd22]|uniref:hypothetical protein n=1 Tax=Streptomyces sp. RTd22 TaxID=1841249 RepID=UPI0007C5681E|nr:hypothetical protein [Streptomyces sp. RTd22]